MIKLNYKSDKPLHEQITDAILELVMLGVLKEDEKLPSVRDLSVELTVNPNTVQRAYKELEATGVIYSIRGKGNFILGEPEASKKTIDNLILALEKNLRELAFFGTSKAEIEAIVEKIYKERDEIDD